MNFYNARITDLGPAEHVTDGQRLAENAFAVFIQVFQNELFDVHLSYTKHSHKSALSVLTTSSSAKKTTTEQAEMMKIPNDRI